MPDYHNAEKGMNTDVFISYSRKDSKVANSFADLLESLGYNIWIDRNGIESGDQFSLVIANAIKSSKVLLFFSSKAANASKWTVGEVAIAKKEGLKIIPIRLDNAEYNDAIKADLVLLDFINYEPDHEFAKTKVVRAIISMLGGNEGANRFVNEDHSRIIETATRSALQKLRRRIRQSILDNLFKYVFCLSAIVFLSILISLQHKQIHPAGTISNDPEAFIGGELQLKDFLEKVNENRDGEYNDYGTAYLNAYVSTDFVVFPMSLYEGEDSTIYLASSYIKNVKMSLIQSLRFSGWDELRNHATIYNERKGIKIQFIGSRTLKEYDVDLTHDELERELIFGLYHYHLEQLVKSVFQEAQTPEYLQSLEIVQNKYADNEMWKDYLTLFVETWKEVSGGKSLAYLYIYSELSSTLPTSSDNDVIFEMRSLAAEKTASDMKLSEEKIIDVLKDE